MTEQADHLSARGCPHACALGRREGWIADVLRVLLGAHPNRALRNALARHAAGGERPVDAR